MKVVHAIAAFGLCVSCFAASPSVAQPLDICGPPPLPRCDRDRPPPPPPRYDERDRPGRGDLGVVCRTRNLRCRTGEPRPIGARCTCEDENGEEVMGRIAR